MTPEEAKKIYFQKYREEHRAEINAKTKEWRAANKDRIKKYQDEYWKRKAEEYETCCNVGADK